MALWFGARPKPFGAISYRFNRPARGLFVINEHYNMKYSREIELQNIKSLDDAVASKALLSITFNDDDWRFIQNLCIELIVTNDRNSGLLAVTCIGHIARMHHKIEKRKIAKAFKKRAGNTDFEGRINDALKDIEMFVQ